MQKTRMTILAVLSACLMSLTVFGQDYRNMFAIKTSLSMAGAEDQHTVSVIAGEVLDFSVDDLERRLALESGELGGITVTSVPASWQGGLFLDGVEVESYDFISRDELNRLCFVPGDNATGASVTFVPQSRGAVTTSLNIQILASANSIPEIEDATFETVQNTSRTGMIQVHDADGDAVTVQVVDKPLKGVVSFEGTAFTYQPFQNKTGSDSFTVCAVDARGAYSRVATVYMVIEKQKQAFSYADMNGNPSQYAALKLRENGLFVGKQIGADFFFKPAELMNRGDYLILLLTCAGLSDSVVSTVNTGLPNDAELPIWIKPWVKAAVEAGIWSDDTPFHWNEIPTRSEAVVLCDRAANITDVRQYNLTMPDLDKIPDWALQSYMDLAAYRMLDLHDGYASPIGALTNSYAADLSWLLFKKVQKEGR